MVLTGFKPRPRLRTQAICCLLGVSIAFPPGQFARAELISMQATLNARQQNPRDVIVAFVRRPDVTTQLRALGVEERAEERIAAMSDDELSTLASSLGSLPAGGQMYPGGGGGGSASGGGYGSSGGSLLPILLIVSVIVGFFWWLFRGAH
jgi:hypothetical protein